MKNLPKNWVIDTEKEKDSPLMPKFMEWFSEFKNKRYPVDSIFLGTCNSIITSYHNLEGIIPLITLEQWNEAYFPEWQPKQGERVLVGDFQSKINKERVFVVKHNETYYCEDKENVCDLVAWPYIKRFPEQSQLQPKIDELKSEAERLGLKIEIIIS